MTEPAEGLHALAKDMGNYSPTQVPGAIKPVLESGGISLLAKTIVEFQATEPGAVDEVLGAVSAAIGSVEDYADRADLAQSAGAIIPIALRNDEFRAGSFAAVGSVAEHGHQILSLLEDGQDIARQRIPTLRRLAMAVVSAEVAGTADDSRTPLFMQADLYLAETAELASDLSNVDKIRQLTSVAGGSLKLYRRAAHLLEGDTSPEAEQALAHLAQQPARFYREAIDAADEAEAITPNTGDQLKSEIISSLFKSAAKIASSDSDVHRQLTKLAAQEIDSILAAYEGDGTSFPPATKAIRLASRGRTIIEALTDKDHPYEPPVDGESPPIDEFIGRAVALFRAADAQSRKLDPEAIGQDYERSARHVTESVSKVLFNLDVGATKELLSIAYGLADKADIDNRRQSLTRDQAKQGVVREITYGANRLAPTRFRDSLELFGLAHGYARMLDGEDVLDSNAYDFLVSVKSQDGADVLPVNALPEVLIEYAAGLAATVQDIEALEALRRLTAKDRETQAKVEEQLAAAREHEAEDHQPRSDVERRMKELLAS